MDSINPVQQAVANLSANDQEAYQEAAVADPDLIEAESKLTWFLQAHEQAAEKAALNLARYWTDRKTAFGQERFTRALTDLSGNGALTTLDMEMLTSGYMVLLPPDRDGRHVIYIDSSRLVNKAGRRHFSRLCFYLAHTLLLQSPSSELVLIRRYALSKQANPGTIAACIDESLRSFELASPLTVHAVHICLDLPLSRVQKMVQSTMPSVLGRMGKELAGKARFHPGKDLEALQTKLEKCGITQIPSSLGGTWSYARFDAWWQQQLEVNSKNELDAKINETEEAALLQMLDGYIKNFELEGEDTETQSGVSKAYFAFGVLGMMQEERNVSLRTLLQEGETQDLLLTLVGEATIPSVDEILKDCVTHIISDVKNGEGPIDELTVEAAAKELLASILEQTNASRVTVSATEQTDASQVNATAETQPASLLSSESSDLLLQVSSMLGVRQDKYVIPSTVQNCLGILCLLEDEQDRRVTALMQDTAVMEVLLGMLDSVNCEDSDSIPATLDVLASRIAKDLSSDENNGRMRDIYRLLQDSEQSGAEVMCAELVGSLLDSALQTPLCSV